MASCYDFMTSYGVMTQIAGNVRVSSTLEVLQTIFSSVSAILWVDKCNNIKITLITCTVDLLVTVA